MSFAPPVALDYLRRAHAAGRFGHAYLLAGAREAWDLALELAALLLGGTPAEVLAHPDVHVLEPESKSRRIVIEQVRELENALRLRAAVPGGAKVGIIREADRLQNQAANAFLKTLEEPPNSCSLFLLSAHPEALPDTILSRCIRVTLRDADGEPDAVDGHGLRTEEEKAWWNLLDRQAGNEATSRAGVAPAYLLLREFTQLLTNVRTRIQAEQEAALKREETRYAQTTDGSWLAERETYYKTLIEARYTAERSRLLQALARWWGDTLRREAAGEPARVAMILRKLAAIESIRENLERNIQEALALEVGFLEVFGG